MDCNTSVGSRMLSRGCTTPTPAACVDLFVTPQLDQLQGPCSPESNATHMDVDLDLCCCGEGHAAFILPCKGDRCCVWRWLLSLLVSLCQQDTSS